MTPWTRAQQAPLSMEFTRQEYWSGLPLPSPEDLPDPGSTLQADSLQSEPPGKPQLCMSAVIFSLLTVSLYFVAQGDICPGATLQ